MILALKIAAVALLYISLACLLGAYLGVWANMATIDDVTAVTDEVAALDKRTTDRLTAVTDEVAALDKRTTDRLRLVHSRLDSHIWGGRYGADSPPLPLNDDQETLWPPPRGELDPEQYLGDSP